MQRRDQKPTGLNMQHVISRNDIDAAKGDAFVARYQTWSALLTVHSILLAAAVAAIAVTSTGHQEAARAAALFATMGLGFTLGCVGLTRVFMLARAQAMISGAPLSAGPARWRRSWIGALEVSSMWLVAFAASGLLVSVLRL